MPALDFTTKYNIAKDGLVISPSTLLNKYLHGIPLTDTDGDSYSISNVEKTIIWETKKLENFLRIKFTEQELTERQDYIIEEWLHWGHIKVEFPVNEITSVKGFMNKEDVIEFNVDLWTAKEKNIALVPGPTNLGNATIIGTNNVFPLLRGGVRTIPDFWQIVYKTGFTTCPPEDILDALGKLVSIQILNVLGDILIGAGIASKSISLDGLSQTINTTQSAENSAYSARVRQYAKELFKELNVLKGTYKGFIFEVF